jgi:endoglucanase
MQGFSQRNDIPVFVGEFNATDKKETPSRVKWMTAAKDAALKRRMVPVLWETGGDIKRSPPYEISDALRGMLGR